MKSALRLVISFLIAFPQSLWANPTVGNVVAGSAGISSSGNTLTVIQASNNAIINWNSFSINQGELTQFIQPSAVSAALNRVTGGNPSAIYGTLQANGRVFLINPNGITVGPTGVINTQSFVASTLDLNNDDFMAGGALRFAGNSAANLINMGRINALGGDVLLIAHTVQNTGEITAPQGTVGLAAGSEVLIQPSGDERVFVQAGGSDKAAVGVDQAGQIKAATAELKAAGGNVYSLAINNSGIIQATGVERRGGRVYLVAEGGDIALRSGSVIDASGANGGGTVLVGGDSQGLNPSVPNASVVTVEEGASIKADATVSGDGGKVVVWGNDATSFKGSISARGGAEGGNGGNVEVSGSYLDYRGYTDLTADKGLMGTLLLDPIDLIISNAANNNLTGTYTSNGSASNLNNVVLQNQLSGANVTVQTGGSTNGAGNITVNNAVTWSGSSASRGALTLSANNNITVNAALTQTGNGSLTMVSNSGNSNNNANAAITLNAAVTTAGNQTYNAGTTGNGIINLNANAATTGSGSQTYNGRVNLQANETLTTNGGAVSFQNTVNAANAGVQGLTVNAGAGSVTFGNTVGGTAALGSVTVAAGAGTTNLSGTLNTSGAQSYGQKVSLNNNTTVNSNGGSVAFNSTVDGGSALTVNAGAGAVKFAAAVGGTTQLDSLAVTGSGVTSLYGPVTTNGTGSQSYGEAVTLGANATLTSNNAAIDFLSSLDAATADAQGLTVSAGTGNISFSNVGTTKRLSSVSLSGSGVVDLNGTVNTNAAQTYAQRVTLSGNSALTTNNAAIALNNTVNGTTAGGQSLTLNSGTAATTIGNAIGGTTRLGALNVAGAGAANLNGGTITSGAQTYGGAVILGANTTLNSNNGAVDFAAAVNGSAADARTLTINAGTGLVSFGDVGTGNRLQSLTVASAGGIDLNGTISTNLGQTYTPNITLSGTSVLSTNNNTVDISGAVNGTSADAQSLTINAGSGNVALGNVGVTQRLSAFNLNNTGSVDLNGTINTNAAQTYAQKIT